MPTLTDGKTKDGPLYRRIQQELRDRIVQGAWALGQALPNRRILCAEFGTTRVTLDKAINGLVQEGWLRAAAGSGTFVSAPTPSSPTLVTGQNDKAMPRLLRVGVVLGRHTYLEPDHGDGGAFQIPMDNYFFGPLFHGIREGLSGTSVQVNYAHVEGGDYLGHFQQSGLDGILLIAPTLEDLPALRRLADASVPFVALAISSDASPEDTALPCLDSDNKQGAFDAVQHLLSLGHRRVALINLALSHADHHDRLVGYQRALGAAGLPVVADHMLFAPTYEYATFEGRIEQWLTCVQCIGALPTAIFATDYLMTLATLKVLRRHGLRVPEDISVVGYDDAVSAAHLMPPLTTVRQPTYQMGRQAAQRLLRHLQEGAAFPLGGTELLANTLIVRESTAPPP